MNGLGKEAADGTQHRKRGATCEQVVAGYADAPEIRHGGNVASYSPIGDVVRMPDRTAFHSPEAYYSTLFHELTHSTGHQKRLGRFTADQPPAPFGTPDYSREELVAELGAALLCARTGISNVTIENCEIVNSSPPTGINPETSENILNILAEGSPNLTVHNVTLRDGSSGIYLLESPGADISHVDGYDFHGPMPRGQFVQFDKSGDSTLTDFYVLNHAGSSYPETNSAIQLA